MDEVIWLCHDNMVISWHIWVIYYMSILTLQQEPASEKKKAAPPATVASLSEAELKELNEKISAQVRKSPKIQELFFCLLQNLRKKVIMYMNIV